MGRLRRYDRRKRALDVLASAVGIVVTLPLQAGVASAIWVTQGRPILFRQARPGLDEQVFELVKFRTMLEATEAGQNDEDRITRLGAFLRSTSLDELPTLWNVLRGDMSLIGPRPLLVKYLPLYRADQARRHEVRPGVTGLAQALGRNSLSWEKKFELDVEYVDRRSLSLDIKILWWSARTVLCREGISQEGHVTAKEFSGSRESGESNVP